MAFLQAHTGAYNLGKQTIIAQLIPNAQLTMLGTINVAHVRLYNPTECRLLSLSITIAGRTYRSDPDTQIDPHSVSRLRYEVLDANLGARPWLLQDVTYGSSAENGSTREGDPTCLGPAPTGE
ncbi:hypothetical protein [Deinococcus yunweiensis]|uniref:hypothetical protein n=1 Tax=Deinococcus yunweiensis TaxID=367282 RepID=UPI00398F86E0